MLKQLVFLASLLCIGACGPGAAGGKPGEAGLQRKILSAQPDLVISGLTIGAVENVKMIVVFIHGTPGSATSWSDTLLKTPPHFFAIALDRPGYANTKPKGPQTSLDMQANAVLQAVRSTAIKHGYSDLPVILVGHSYGAPVTVKAALAAPQDVDAIVLAAGALDPGLEEIHWAQRLATWQPVKFLIGRTLRNANAELLSLKDELMLLKTQLGALEVPVFILHGSADDLVPIANVNYMLEAFPSDTICETRVLEGQNHFLPWNEIDALWAMIERASQGVSLPC